MAGAPLGEIVYSSVIPMIRMYMIIGSGFFLTRKGYFGVTAARAFSDMVMMIFMPSLVFDKIVSYISISDIKTIGVICFCAVIMYLINSCIAILIVYFTPIPKNSNNRWVGGALLAGIMQNVSDLPISYIQAVTIFSLDQQNKGTAYVIIWLAMYVLVQFNCGLFKLVEWDFEYKDKLDEENIENKEINDNNNNNNKDKNDNDDHMDIAIDSETSSSSRTDSVQQQQRQSFSSESPISPTSSIMSDDSNTINNPTRKRRFSEKLDPLPLSEIKSNVSHLSRVLTNKSFSSNIALSKVASARNLNKNENNLINQSNDDLISLNQELIREYSHVQPFNQNMSTTMKIITETNITDAKINENEGGNKITKFLNKCHLGFIVFFLSNFKKPNSVVLVISIIIALIPWLKALFVETGTVQLPNAPNQKPPLNFILLYAEYLGYPCVPMGLLLIGSVLARLEFNQVPKGFWKSAVCHTIFRLCILPIIGTAFITRLKNIGWIDDPMAIFVCIMEYALPSATVQIYLTAAAMKPNDKTCTPLNCVGLYMILQYLVLVISMPITVCYCIKNPMGM